MITSRCNNSNPADCDYRVDDEYDNNPLIILTIIAGQLTEKTDHAQLNQPIKPVAGRCYYRRRINAEHTAHTFTAFK